MTPLLTTTKIKCHDAKGTEFDLMKRLMEQLPPTEVVGKRWFSYNKATGCWEDNDKDHYRHLALAVIHPTKRQVHVAHRVLDHLEDMIRKKLHFYGFIKGESFDTILINTRNKVLRVSPATIEVLDHDMEYRFTRALEVDYDPEARHELYEQVRQQILSDPLDLKLLQLLAANIFIPDARYEASAVLYGEAGAGKDTIMAPIVALFGPPERGLITYFSIAQICDPGSYALPQLQFAALNLCTELNSKEVEDSSIFKTLVSGGSLPARQIYDKPFNMTTPCKTFSLSNNLPEFRGGTDAEKRRLRFIRCNYRPEVVDISVKERLKVPHPGTLNWLLEGLQELLKRGIQPMPFGGESSQEVHNRFFANNDPIKGFITAYCIFDKNTETPKEQLRDLFKLYAEDNDISEGFVKTFFRSLYKRYPNLVPKRGGNRFVRTQLVSGILINEEGRKLLQQPEPIY